MKIVLYSLFSPVAREVLLRDFPQYDSLDFAGKMQAHLHYNYWQRGWAEALRGQGYDAMIVPFGTTDLLETWAREQGVPLAHNEALANEMVRRFQPDALIFHHHMSRLLRAMRESTPSIRLAMVMIGVSVIDTELYRYAELMISSSPDTIEQYQRHGAPHALVAHAFYPPLLEQFRKKPDENRFVFAGSIIRRANYHYGRDRLLAELVRRGVPIEIYSTALRYATSHHTLKTLVKQAVYPGVWTVQQLPPLRRVLSRFRYLEHALDLPDFPRMPVNPALKPHLKPPVFGNEMLQLLADASIVLNTHRDDQATASNMRMYETTGVGTCLLTDWKPNLHKYFADGEEVVAFRNVDDCVEKVKWLLDHPEERRRIAEAGQRRTLRDHTFDQRAAQLDELIRGRIGGKGKD